MRWQIEVERRWRWCLCLVDKTLFIAQDNRGDGKQWARRRKEMEDTTTRTRKKCTWTVDKVKQCTYHYTWHWRLPIVAIAFVLSLLLLLPILVLPLPVAVERQLPLERWCYLRFLGNLTYSRQHAWSLFETRPMHRYNLNRWWIPLTPSVVMWCGWCMAAFMMNRLVIPMNQQRYKVIYENKTWIKAAVRMPSKAGPNPSTYRSSMCIWMGMETYLLNH